MYKINELLCCTLETNVTQSSIYASVNTASNVLDTGYGNSFPDNICSLQEKEKQN